MKPLWLVATATLVLLSACSSTAPPPDWQANAFEALKGFSSAYLRGDTRLAELELTRAKNEINRTGRADLLARAELTRCAVRTASLEFEPCVAYLPLAAESRPEEQAYAAFLTGDWRALNAALLPPHYRALVLQTATAPLATSSATAGQAPDRLHPIQDPLARLIAAGILLQRSSLLPHELATATDTAASQGWRRPLLAWLGVQLKRADGTGDTESAHRLQNRINRLLQTPARD